MPHLKIFFGLPACTIVLLAQTCPAAAETGKGLYDQQCAKCHGAGGKGDGKVGRFLKPRPTNFTDAKLMHKRSDEFLTTVIAKGGPAKGLAASMPPYGDKLSPTQVKELIVYLRHFSASGKRSGQHK